MPLSIRLAAAQHALGLATTEQLRQAADAALTRGVYTYSLGELATSPDMVYDEAEPLFAAALRELGVPPPTSDEAALSLTKHYLGRIAEGAVSPRDGVLHFEREVLVLDRVSGVSAAVERPPEWSALSHWVFEYEYVRVLEAEGDMGQRAEQLDREVTAFAQGWMRRHGLSGFAPSWLTSNDGAVRKLAWEVHDLRAFEQLPILADALEDAGCTDADALDHCRHGGAHVHSCWVVDLLLGKR